MTTLTRGLLRWSPVLVILTMVVLQGLHARPRLRHSHRKLRCSKCPPGWGVVQPCSESRDTGCAACQTGHYSPHHSYHSPCWLCSRCGAGLFEAHTCTSVADTVCDDCHRLFNRPRRFNTDFYDKCISTNYTEMLPAMRFE